MVNEELTFDKLPQAVGYLIRKIEQLEKKIDTITPAVDSKQTTIDIDTAANIIQKAKSTIYTMVRLGRIPAYKKGKKLYFIEEELRQWLIESPTLNLRKEKSIAKSYIFSKGEKKTSRIEI